MAKPRLSLSGARSRKDKATQNGNGDLPGFLAHCRNLQPSAVSRRAGACLLPRPLWLLRYLGAEAQGSPAVRLLRYLDAEAQGSPAVRLLRYLGAEAKGGEAVIQSQRPAATDLLRGLLEDFLEPGLIADGGEVWVGFEVGALRQFAVLERNLQPLPAFGCFGTLVPKRKAGRR